MRRTVQIEATAHCEHGGPGGKYPQINVCSWVLADMMAALGDVRFWG
jgi:hypothetical protein